MAGVKTVASPLNPDLGTVSHEKRSEASFVNSGGDASFKAIRRYDRSLCF